VRITKKQGMEYIRQYPVLSTVAILFCVTATLLVLFDAPFIKSTTVSVDGVEIYAIDVQKVAILSGFVTALWYFWPNVSQWVSRWLE
jgi:hypothetical protein